MIEETLYNEMCNEFFPIFKKLAGTDVYSITLGGSHGKGISDRNSDFDFRIYYEKSVEQNTRRIIFEEINQLVSEWKAKNVEVDGIFPRTYSQVDEQLELWLTGNGKLVPYEWTVWGYNILTDIYNQQIIEDPYGRATQWKERLSVYPEALKASIIKKHASSLKYWRNDYHYLNKVKRKDVVFLSSITARLIQDIVQVIYAMNEFYYPGDGMNLKYSQLFEYKPYKFEERITEILHISESDDGYEIQYKNMTGLIDDVLSLTEKHSGNKFVV